jgi:hypothetical protein
VEVAAAVMAALLLAVEQLEHLKQVSPELQTVVVVVVALQELKTAAAADQELSSFDIQEHKEQLVEM